MHEEKCKAILAQTLRSRLTCWIVLRMDPLGACYKQLSARKNRRYAINGNLYTWQQYQEYYWKRGYQSVLSAWESSAHFKDLSEFIEYFHVQVVPSSPLKQCRSSAVFGILLPTCLLLVDVHGQHEGVLPEYGGVVERKLSRQGT